MKIPKCLINFSNQYNVDIVPIRYKAQGIYCKRKGFDIVDSQTKRIIISFEPVNYNYYPEKWMVRDVSENYTGPKEFQRLSAKILSHLDKKLIHPKISENATN